MEAPSSHKLGKRVRRALVSHVVACWLMGAMLGGVFLYDQAGRETGVDWWAPFIIIPLSPIAVPIVIFWVAAEWFIGPQPGERTVWWPVPVFAIIWAVCFKLTGRWMGCRDGV